MTIKERFEKWWNRKWYSVTQENHVAMSYAAYRAGFAAGKRASGGKAEPMPPKSGSGEWRYFVIYGKGCGELTPAEAERRFPGSVKGKK